MRARLHAFSRDTRGASAVEFALVATPLLLMLFGSIEYGRLLYTQHAISQTANATARCFALPQAECEGGLPDARSFAQSVAQSFAIVVQPADVEVTSPANCGGIDGFARARVVTTFTTPLPEAFIGFAGGSNLAAEACFPLPAA